MNYQEKAKPAYLNPALTRPDWTVDHSRNTDTLWLDKNENVDPILNEKICALFAAIPKNAVNTYPESAKVYRRLSEIVGLPAANLLLTNGSDGAIRALFDVFVSPGDKVLRSHPTFAMYEVYSQMFGAKEIRLPYGEGEGGPRFDFPAFLKLIESERPKLVCLPNPDSPSGTVLTPMDMEKLIAATKSAGSLLLIDEAYFPFYEHTVLPLIAKHEHLFVARSFSKAWGAAGLRVGFLAGPAALMQLAHKNRAMYEIGALSNEMLYALLGIRGEVEASVKRLLAGKKYFAVAMRELGFPVTETHGNFIHVKFGAALPKVEAALRGQVLYRHFANAPGLVGFTRFSLGTEEQFRRVVELIRKGLA